MNEIQELKDCGELTIQEIIDILGEDFCDYTLDVLSASGLDFDFVNKRIGCDDGFAEYLKEHEGQINVLKNIYDVYNVCSIVKKDHFLDRNMKVNLSFVGISYNIEIYINHAYIYTNQYDDDDDFETVGHTFHYSSQLLIKLNNIINNNKNKRNLIKNTKVILYHKFDTNVIYEIMSY